MSLRLQFSIGAEYFQYLDINDFYQSKLNGISFGYTYAEPPTPHFLYSSGEIYRLNNLRGRAYRTEN
jgi:hypothetical protein